MNHEDLYQLFLIFRSDDEELIMTASNELLAFYSSPESLPILSSLYLSTEDKYFKDNILIGINRALNNENLLNITPEQLSEFQDNLILMLTHETNKYLLSEIKSFFKPILEKSKGSWDSLDNYIYSDKNSSDDEYFYVLIYFITMTKTNEDCDSIIEFVLPRLQNVFQTESSFQAQLSAFCFITNISIKMGHRDFLWEFTEAFKSFFLKVCHDTSHRFLNSFIELLRYIEYAIESAEFSKQVTPLNDIIEYCLSEDADYSNCINLRIFINDSLIASETDLADLEDLLVNLIELTKKFYSTEIDIQTQRIDDYFPVLKYIPFDDRRDFCISHIEDLIQENTPASICAALSLFRGALISGITFDQNNLDFFMQCYDIDHLGVKMIAGSTLIDVFEEISIEIEENSDTLIDEFCKSLDNSFELSVEDREQFVLSILEILQCIISLCTSFSDETCEQLQKSLFTYIQDGSPIEQYKSLFPLYLIISRSSKVALDQSTIDLIFEILQIPDPYLKQALYEILILYLELYPRYFEKYSIIESISNESDDDIFVIAEIIGHIAIKYPLDEQIKEFILSKIPLILNISEIKDKEILNLSEDCRGLAISSLLYILSAYSDLITNIFPCVINSIANLIFTQGATDTNIQYIAKGINVFTNMVTLSDYNIPSEAFNPIFEAIENRFQNNEQIVGFNLFEILNLMTNFVECNNIPNIDNFVCIALRVFVNLIKSDEKKDIKGIQEISNFVRTAFENHDSEPMKEMGIQLIGVILDQLTNKQSSSLLEGHLVLILSPIVANQIECFDDYNTDLVSFLIDKMQTSIPNTAKNVALFFKNLANSEYLMEFLDNDQQILQLIWNSLVDRLSKNSEINTLLRLNDNIISALTIIEKNTNIFGIDEFYKMIAPFLPAFTDEYEFFDIYSSLLDLFPTLNEENLNDFIEVLIRFYSYRNSTFLNNALIESDREDQIILIYKLINEKLESIDDSQLFINSLIQDENSRFIFAQNLNYIIYSAQSLMKENEESEEHILSEH